MPTSRRCYGDPEQFKKVWSCLVETLSGTESISDFSEFKYRDNLREQVSFNFIDGDSMGNSDGGGLWCYRGGGKGW